LLSGNKAEMGLILKLSRVQYSVPGEPSFLAETNSFTSCTDVGWTFLLDLSDHPVHVALLKTSNKAGVLNTSIAIYQLIAKVVLVDRMTLKTIDFSVYY